MTINPTVNVLKDFGVRFFSNGFSGEPKRPKPDIVREDSYLSRGGIFINDIGWRYGDMCFPY